MLRRSAAGEGRLNFRGSLKFHKTAPRHTATVKIFLCGSDRPRPETMAEAVTSLPPSCACCTRSRIAATSGRRALCLRPWRLFHSAPQARIARHHGCAAAGRLRAPVPAAGGGAAASGFGGGGAAAAGASPDMHCLLKSRYFMPSVWFGRLHLLPLGGAFLHGLGLRRRGHDGGGKRCEQELPRRSTELFSWRQFSCAGDDELGAERAVQSA